MPTYEYECSSCHHRFERSQPITAKQTHPCPRCRKRAKRLFSSGAGFLFKGSGFYATDYRSSEYRSKAKSEKSSSSSTPPCKGKCATDSKSS